ncbi:pirin family protein [Marinomonas transparens]|uniref:Pirin family protein n=1 Tax=Marinomonas transparens TaxID=2795388 RepID=A0A934MZG6_9GAMM|nr:pirin family protein [Marinomonas transparens]MBJ7537520.1 pirin family protein [Marinomonas transparens]
MSTAILKRLSLDMFWPTFDPFLFCAFHDDNYPKANVSMGPAASLAGRPLGQDFSRIDNWSMYHGKTIPGFPAHPHRGFETVTIVNKGLVDHADSMGASGRYGEGDTQWMTAGEGVQHSEMFPLLNEEGGNPLELFQIWLNLPSKNKMVPPHFTMLWNEDTPVLKQADGKGREVSIKVVAGALEAVSPAPCPPNSWAADANNHVAIWLIDLPENAQWTLPAGSENLSRTLYFFEGERVELDGAKASVNEAFMLKSDASIVMQNLGKPARFLVLQGRPIGESVEQHGPFVMNTRAELQQAFSDYQRTQFGGWPWPRHDQVHDRSKDRFAEYADQQKG